MAINRENTRGESRGRSLNVCRDLKPNLVRGEGGPALLQQQFDDLLVSMQYLPVEALEIHTLTSAPTSLQYPENSKSEVEEEYVCRDREDNNIDKFSHQSPQN